MRLACQKRVGTGGVALAACLGVDAIRADRLGIDFGSLGSAAKGVFEDDDADLAGGELVNECLGRAAVEHATHAQARAFQDQLCCRCGLGDARQDDETERGQGAQ